MNASFWLYYGWVMHLLLIMSVLTILHLLFVLQRRHASVLLRVALTAGAGWLALGAVTISLQEYASISHRVGLPALPFVFWDSVIWQTLIGLNGSCFAVSAGCFLALALAERRSKTRVARRRET